MAGRIPPLRRKLRSKVVGDFVAACLAVVLLVVVGGQVGGWTITGMEDSQTVQFDGVDDTVSLTVTDSVKGDAPHTIVAWLLPQALPSKRAWILLRGVPGAGAHHWLINSQGGTQFSVWGGTQVQPSLLVGQWTHVAVTYDGGRLKSYINGELKQDRPVSGTKFNLSGDLSIGRAFIGENFWKGQIDGLAIYNRALSAGEIKEIHPGQLWRIVGVPSLVKWGSQGNGDGQFNLPTGVAADSQGNVYVVDWSNNRIQKFTSSGVFVTKWGRWGGVNGRFYGPRGVAADSQENVYVADWSNHRIQKFTSSGQFVTKWGSQGSGNGRFKNPTGLAADS